MTNPPRVLDLSGLHIVRTLRAAPDFLTKIPGNIWSGVAPAGVLYPHMVYSYVTGDDRPALGQGGWGPSNLLILIKIIDRSDTPGRARPLVAYVEGLLFAESAQGSTISGVPVSVERDSPFSLPVVEDDTLFQQEGGMYRFWVEDYGGS